MMIRIIVHDAKSKAKVRIRRDVCKPGSLRQSALCLFNNCVAP